MTVTPSRRTPASIVLPSASLPLGSLPFSSSVMISTVNSSEPVRRSALAVSRDWITKLVGVFTARFVSRPAPKAKQLRESTTLKKE